MTLARSLLLVAALSLAAQGCAVSEPAGQAVLFVSGRDDHGLLATPFVALYREPDGRVEAARVPDATFVRVLETRSTWLRVRAIAPPGREGWVNDFYLRNEALWLDRGLRVRFVDAALRGRDVVVLVRGTGRVPEWVEARRLREVGAR